MTFRGLKEPLDLKIVVPTSTNWDVHSLALTAPGLLLGETPASRLIEAVQASGEVTVEAWVCPAKADFQGLQRLVTLSNGAWQRNLILGQNGGRYHAALRTTLADGNAASQGLSGGHPRPGELDHLILTRSRDGVARLYLNGDLMNERQTAGDFTAWDPTFSLALGNELDASGPERAWLGAFHLVALYERALTPTEVRLHYEFGADTNLPPILSAGQDLLINWPVEKSLPITAKLSGRLTHDRPEKETQIAWAQVAGPQSPNGVEFSNPFELETTASFLGGYGQYRLRLTADDGELMNSAELTVVVNQPPSLQLEYVAVAALTGETVEVPVRAVVLASGLGQENKSTDGQSPLMYAWEQTGGPVSLVISNRTEADICLRVKERGVYSLMLKVDNGVLPVTYPFTLTVHQPPVASAGPNQTLSLPLDDQLAGKGVTSQLLGATTDTGLGDPSQPLEYCWAQVSGPQPVTFVDEADPQTKVTFPHSGRYRLALTVTNPAMPDPAGPCRDRRFSEPAAPD